MSASSSKGRILLADDEATFVAGLAELLRIEGYECQTVPDGLAAAAELNTRPNYDLLIADIRMPGNANLELIRHLPQLSPGLSAMLVTAYPDLKAAIGASDLPVLSYLVKPIEMSKFLPLVRRAVMQTAMHRANLEITQRLRKWVEDSEMMRKLLDHSPPNPGIGPDAFINLSLRNILGCLSELDAMWQKASDKKNGTAAPDALRDALGAAMRAFESSSPSFEQ